MYVTSYLSLLTSILFPFLMFKNNYLLLNTSCTMCGVLRDLYNLGGNKKITSNCYKINLLDNF